MPVRSEPVSLCFNGSKPQSSREDVIQVSPTRTTTRPIEQVTCRTLVEHFEPEVKTQPLPVVTVYDEALVGKFEVIQSEVTRMLVRTLLVKRLLIRLFFMKGRPVVIPINGYTFDLIKDKVSCSATQALIADKQLLRELLENAAKNACAAVAGVKFVRFMPHASPGDKSSTARSDAFTIEVDIA